MIVYPSQTANVLHCKVHAEDVVPRQEQQCGIGGEVAEGLSSVLRESEAGISRAWCAGRSGLDIVGGMARAKQKAGTEQNDRHDHKVYSTCHD